MGFRSLLSLGMRWQSDTQSSLGGESMIRGDSWRSWLFSLLNPRRFVRAEARLVGRCQGLREGKGYQPTDLGLTARQRTRPAAALSGTIDTQSRRAGPLNSVVKLGSSAMAALAP